MLFYTRAESVPCTYEMHSNYLMRLCVYVSYEFLPISFHIPAKTYLITTLKQAQRGLHHSQKRRQLSITVHLERITISSEILSKCVQLCCQSTQNWQPNKYNYEYAIHIK